MSGVRPLDPADIPAVADLFRAAMGPDNPLSRPWVGDFLTETLFHAPWVDPEIPSLVATDDDEAVVGFIASNVRHVRVDGEQRRASCCAHLVVDAGSRSRATGPQLLSRWMAGPQDLSFTDSATDVVARMWRTFGGRADPLRTCGWMLVLRPAAWTAAVGRARISGARPMGLATVPALPFHLAGSRLTGHVPVEAGPEATSEPLTPAALVEHLPAILKGFRLHVAYDEAYTAWTLRQVAALYPKATVVPRLVRRGGRPVGWYVLVHDPAGPGRVLQLGARERDVDAVVGALVSDARERGVAVLTGRLEPDLVEPLRRRWAVVGFDARALVHAKDPVILDALSGGPALLSRLDGEWW